MANVLRNIPSVNELLESPPLQKLVQRVNRSVVVSGVRDFLDGLRAEVQSAASDMKLPNPKDLAERIAQWIVKDQRPALQPVINATGILLHTGLGRAPLAEEAIQSMAEISRGYASLEVDLVSGQRSKRVEAVERLLQQVTGAEAAAVVNNNAGATLIALAALASDREVIVSRGQLIEIGGSYRLPDVMSASGARLREVGTTNKTRISDYQSAINVDTAALLHVHTSNYIVAGFSEETPLHELVAVGQKRGLLVIDDIGSGALWDFSRYGISGEPMCQDSIRAGSDIVLFSGDKLLGGPQCGIILGRKKLIEKINQHPLARALRVDKTTLAALAATLRLYQEPERAEQAIPLLSLLSTPIENLKHRAERLALQLAAVPGIASAEAIESHTYLGGGAVPTQRISTWCVAMVPDDGSVDDLAVRFRLGTPAIYGRIQDDRLLLDLRTVFPAQDLRLVDACHQLLPKDHAESSEVEPET